MNKRILIADDDKDLLSVYKYMFSSTITTEKPSSHIVLETFEDGKYLLEHFKKEYVSGADIPLCILDIKMPVLNGLETAKEIRKIDPQVIIIIVTADMTTGPDKIRENLEQDIYYVKKPFKEEELFCLVDSLLKSWNKNHALRESEKKYRNIFETFLDIYYLTDIDGKIAEISHAITCHTGHTPDELIGSNIKDLCSDSRDWDHIINNLETSPTINDYDMKLKTKKGITIEFSVYALHVKDNDQCIGVEGVLREISNRKEIERTLKDREERLKAVLDNVVDGIITTDDKGRILTFNPAAEKLFGYRAKEILKKNINLLTPEPFSSQHKNYMKNYLNTGMGTIIGHGRECVGLRKGNIEFPIDLAINEMKVDSDIFFTGIVRDITERKKAETELKKAKEKAEIANRAKSEFLANMSHEIRTPMNAIIGMTGLALETELNSEQKYFLNVVKNSSEALMCIINDILDFSKIEAGQINIEETSFNIRELVENVIEIFSVSTSDKKIELISYVEPEIPSFIIGDANILRQILVNLLGNAVKFTDEGEVVLNVGLSSSFETEKVKLHFSVSDTGIGIGSESIDTIFERFSQVDSSSTRRFSGTGLGLSISKSLLELMGGKIWVESEEKRGTTFHFTLSSFYELDNEENSKDFSYPDFFGYIQSLKIRHILIQYN